MDNDFNWEILHYCTYPVPNSAAYESGYESGCGEPAIVRVWWKSYDDAMLVCQNHFDKLLKEVGDER